MRLLTIALHLDDGVDAEVVEEMIARAREAGREFFARELEMLGVASPGAVAERTVQYVGHALHDLPEHHPVSSV
jgi:hypothetical protein